MSKLCNFINGIIMILVILSIWIFIIFTRTFHILLFFIDLEINQVRLLTCILNCILFLKFLFHVFCIHESLSLSLLSIELILWTWPRKVVFVMFWQMLDLGIFLLVCMGEWVFVCALGFELFVNNWWVSWVKCVICFSESVIVIVFVVVCFWLNDLCFAFGNVGKHLTGVFGVLGLRVVGIIILIFHQPVWLCWVIGMDGLTAGNIKWVFGMFRYWPRSIFIINRMFSEGSIRRWLEGRLWALDHGLFILIVIVRRCIVLAIFP